jgi:hypothetical protein
MAETARNVILAMVAVTSLHIAILSSERAHHKGETLGASVDHTPADARKQCLRDEQFYADKAAAAQVGESRSVGAITGTTNGAGMPMDGLREMFEFASARGTWGSECDRPDLGPAADGSNRMKRTSDVYPEQIAGPYAVVNSYEDEGIANGGGVGSGRVAAFDGWGDVACFEACQTDGTNSQ